VFTLSATYSVKSNTIIHNILNPLSLHLFPVLISFFIFFVSFFPFLISFFLRRRKKEIPREKRGKEKEIKRKKNVTQSRFIEMIYKKDIYVKGLMTGVTLGLQI
jgi:hypothetical protein